MLRVVYVKCSCYSHHAECRYAERRYAECRYAECRGAINRRHRRAFSKSLTVKNRTKPELDI